MRWTNDMDVNTLNMGAGLKILLSKYAIIKLELNYRSSTWNYEYNYNYAYLVPKIDYTYSNIGLLCGIGIIL